jgi:hypothetical protein
MITYIKFWRAVSRIGLELKSICDEICHYLLSVILSKENLELIAVWYASPSLQSHTSGTPTAWLQMGGRHHATDTETFQFFLSLF